MQTLSDLISSLFHWAIFLGIVLGILVWITYNRLQKLSLEVKEKNSNIQVALGKKISEINQLMTMVKGYQEFEQFTQLKIAADASPAALAAAYEQSGLALSALQVATQKFPELQTSSQYHRINDSIQSCERDIQHYRELYNFSVKQYNGAYLSIPTVLIAPMLGFSKAPFLEFDTSGMPQANALSEFKTDDGERLRLLLGQAGNAIADTGKTLMGKAAQATKSLGSGGTPGTASGTTIEAAVPGPAVPAAPQFFYLVPGGVPAGPATIAEIRMQVAEGKLPLTVQVAPVGSSTWVPIQEAVSA